MASIRDQRLLPGRAVGCVGLLGAVMASGLLGAQVPVPLNHFEPNVLAYEAEDRTSPPPKGAILLAGDSQFFRWTTLHEDLPDFTVVNRGIDSFQTADLVYYAERLVIPHRPRMIVTHIGGNDVNNGKSAEQILVDFKAFVTKVRAAMPNVPILFSSITPGPGRWDQAERRTEVNSVMKHYVASQKGMAFIDLWRAMLTKDGQPREDLWVEDRIHPNHEGYLIRVRLMRPLLGPPDRPAGASR